MGEDRLYPGKQRAHPCSSEWCKRQQARKINLGPNFIGLNVGLRNMNSVPWETENPRKLQSERVTARKREGKAPFPPSQGTMCWPGASLHFVECSLHFQFRNILPKVLCARIAFSWDRSPATVAPQNKGLCFSRAKKSQVRQLKTDETALGSPRGRRLLLLYHPERAAAIFLALWPSAS